MSVGEYYSFNGIVGYAVTTANTAPTEFTSCTSTTSLSTTVSGKTVESTMLYPLNPLKADLESTVSQPFDSSPYGVGSCSYQKPWANLLN